MGAPKMMNISAKSLKTITMTTSGRMSSKVTLEIETLNVAGSINGHSIETQTEVQKLYKLMSYIDELELEKTTVEPGKPPRGSTKFELKYQDGHSLILGMNLNDEGLEYYELGIEKFQALHDLWMNL